MNISYLAPLSRAWHRMIRILFKPFFINKWFALGVSAFLAGLLDWIDEGTSSFDDERGWFDAEEFFSIPEQFQDWLAQNPDWFGLIVGVVIVVIALIVLLTWLSSRGKFMFLDNVIHNRALIKQPWHEFKKLGDSLFLWRLGYAVVLIFVFSSFLAYGFYEIRDMYEMYSSDAEMIYAAIKFGIGFVLLLIITGYISLFLDDFIVPIMYKTGSITWIGWSHFMPLFTQHIFYFLLYGLFMLVLTIVIVMIIVIAGFLTCCIGFIFLIIPYIGSVLLLPISVTVRGFSIEFLEQFGDDYKFFPEDEAETENKQ